MLETREEHNIAVVVITSDNPRSEDPERIVEEVKRGADAETRQSSASIVTEVDRREAILQAVRGAASGDVVLIAGKGHETYQILPTGKIHFDDREVARDALAERKRLRNGGVRKNGA